jgi:hypothetical protein
MLVTVLLAEPFQDRSAAPVPALITAMLLAG